MSSARPAQEMRPLHTPALLQKFEEILSDYIKANSKLSDNKKSFARLVGFQMILGEFVSCSDKEIDKNAFLKKIAIFAYEQNEKTWLGSSLSEKVLEFVGNELGLARNAKSVLSVSMFHAASVVEMESHQAYYERIYRVFRPKTLEEFNLKSDYVSFGDFSRPDIPTIHR